jgi:hypothetical protein
LVSIGAFIGQLDATIVQLALPDFGQDIRCLAGVGQLGFPRLSRRLRIVPADLRRLCEMSGRKSPYLIDGLRRQAASP